MKEITNPQSLLQLIPEDSFKKLVDKWYIDKKVKSLSTSKQFKIMALSYIFGIRTLREIEMAFGVPRSTFGDACQKRSSGFFEELSKTLLFSLHAHSKNRNEKRAIRDLLAIDSTHIKLPSHMARVFGWRSYGNKLKGEAKAHVVWNVNKKWIEQCRVTGATVNDLTAGKMLKLRSGCTYVFDRAYVDLSFWIKIEMKGSHFVTRLKKLGKEKVIVRKILNRNKNKTGILFDGEWYPSHTSCRRADFSAKVLTYRQIIYKDPETKRVFHFITSDFKIDAQEVANIYKKRWSIELLFKWMKGHLNIRSFGVKSKNGVRSWIAVSICVHLLLSLKKMIESYKGTLWELFREIKIQSMFKEQYLRAYRDPPYSNSALPGPSEVT